MNLITVLGASGFIGSHLVKKLKSQGYDYYAPHKDEDVSKKNLGNIIYCIGLTADFRTKPFDTVEAHVCYLSKVLKQYKFDSLLYLSSTRVYGVREDTAYEEDVIHNRPLDFSDLYNISKIMGESICFAAGKDKMRVVRLSNVYGYDSKSENFIFSLIRDALRKKKIVLNTTLDSSKDHISVHDVVNVLPEIAIHGKQKIYNVACGENIAAGQIVETLSKLTGCTVEVDKNAERICFPNINTIRIKEEFDFKPSRILDDLAQLIDEYKTIEGAKK
jgi:nucleoside-diphosphate-sugar epimerase